MNKSEIVARVAARMRLDKFTAEGAVDTVLAAIAAGLAKEEDVRIAGFGTLRTGSRPARTGERSDTFEAGCRKSGSIDRFLSSDVRLAQDRRAGH